MYDQDRRSLSSRFYRYTISPRVAREAILLMVLGWTMTLIAGTNPAPDETAIHLSFLMAVIGGFLAFMGVFAGISKWVADPSARRIISEHKDEGISAHPEYIGRTEWDAKHTVLMNEIEQIKVMLARIDVDHKNKES